MILFCIMALIVTFASSTEIIVEENNPNNNVTKKNYLWVPNWKCSLDIVEEVDKNSLSKSQNEMWLYSLNDLEREKMSSYASKPSVRIPGPGARKIDPNRFMLEVRTCTGIPLHQKCFFSIGFATGFCFWTFRST